MAQELSFYFSFTNSKTKMAHTPTVTGNWAACASCSVPPRGMAKERTNIAAAVSIPRISLVFGVMVVSASSLWVRPVEVATIRSGRLRTFYAGMQRTQRRVQYLQNTAQEIRSPAKQQGLRNE